ncbi:hypothetical protein RB653_004986 [Dictyostelium firmibasis]|uniref:F-box domain-containing protein n=1 Tax=Dictyostelium firmibasis TaxID=79012 RepID=A0AAN7UAL1_9MYCE
MQEELDFAINLEKKSQKERELKRNYLITVRQEYEREEIELEGLFGDIVINDNQSKIMIFGIKSTKMINDMEQLTYQKNRTDVMEKMLKKYNKNTNNDHCLNDLTLSNLKSKFGYNIDILKLNSDYFISIDQITTLSNDCFTTYSNNITIKLFIILEHFIFYYNKSIPSLINQKEFTNFLSNIWFDSSPLIRSTLFCYQFYYNFKLNLFSLYLNIFNSYEKLSQFLLNNGVKELEYLVKITFCSVIGDQEEDFLMNLLSCRPKHHSQFHLTSILKDFLQFGGCNKGSVDNISLFSFYFTEIINLEKLNFKLNKSMIGKEMIESPTNDINISKKNLNDVILLNIFKYLILIKDCEKNEDNDNYYGFKNGIDIVNLSMVSNRFHRLMSVAMSLIDWSLFDNIGLLRSEVDYGSGKCIIKDPPSFNKYHILIKTTSGSLFKKVCKSIKTLVIDTLGVYPFDFTLDLVNSGNIYPPFGSFENLKSLTVVGRASFANDNQIRSGLFGLVIQYIILYGNSKLLNFTLVDKVHTNSSYDIDLVKLLLKCHSNTLESFNLVYTSKKLIYHTNEIINLVLEIPSIKINLFEGNKRVENIE